MTIAIVDGNGKTVKTRLADQTESAGVVTLNYYGYDDANVLLPSGTYTVVVVATDASQDLAIASTTITI